MTINFARLRSHFTPQRVVAGVVFLPLLAYVFPPFLAAELPFSLRLLFWAGVMVLALTVVWLARKVVERHQILVRLPARDLAYAVVILLMFTPTLWLLAWLLFTWGGHMAPEMATVASYGILFATGLLLVRRAEWHEVAVEPEPELKPMPRLARRLPEGFRGEFYRLTVRDHNVDVVTSEGTFTIRSRFTDAIDEMEPVAGHCSHRSHWVCDEAVVGVERSEGKIFLRLVNGDLVPVSRKYRPMLEEDGLI